MTVITPACAHAHQMTCPTRHMPCRRASELPLAEAQSQISASPQHAKETVTSKDGPSILTGVLTLLMVKPQLDWVPSLDLTMEN